ncbi:hypothetical protein Goari_015180 [Gossypium aridum]|uniref:ClpA/ClpB AAA lid domain-containing protein n=1 Tax=Gossypium aridum TaxID=34290 RepID=A0A7J8XK32_GOSAI|nr:hypothetical protein [Gossypium aridum]
MPNWLEWDPCEGDEQASKFPAFKLEIYECGRLVVSISCFSSLCELIIDGCEELVDEVSSSAEEVTSLKSMFLRNISKFDISAEKALLRFANSDAFHISAIDLIDEAGSRVRLRHAQLPEEAKDLEKELWQLTKAQITAIQEKDKEMNKGVEGSLVVTEADIQHIVSSWTGFLLRKFQLTNFIDSLRWKKLFISESLVRMKLLKPLAVPFAGPVLTSLQELNISGEGCPHVVSFPEEGIGMTLPPSLTSIFIQKFENLECMWSMGFQHLTSLQQLQIYTCPKLTSLPEKDMLLSLEHLLIYICPLLEEGCSRGKGRDWSKVAHIPYVQIVVQTVIPMGLD